MQTEISYSKETFFPYSPLNNAPTQGGEFNVFAGFAAKYDPILVINNERIAPILTHIRLVFACGNEALSDYILRWMAHLCQQPAKKMGVALLFKSQQGAGKNLVWDFFRKRIIGGAHSVEITDVDQLVQRFNSVSANMLLTVCNEMSNFGGAHKSNDKLKNLITGDENIIERKGIDVIRVRDFNNYVMLTNNEWSIKVEASDRRYLPIEISNERVGDKAYFARMWSLLEDNPDVADHFYNYLMRLDLSEFVPSQIPATEYKQKLKLNSVPPPVHWLISVLQGEDERFDMQAESKVATKTLYEAYSAWVGRNNIRDIFTERAFAQVIGQVVTIKKIRIGDKTPRGCELSGENILAGLRLYLKMPNLQVDDLS